MEWSWFPVGLSFYVATMATIITFFIGIIAVQYVGSKKFRAKVMVETLFFLPLVLPPTVIGFLLIIIFGVNGPIGTAYEWIFGNSIMFTSTAAILAAVIVAFPLMYQSVKTGFLSVDENILGAAKVDGASNLKILLFIIIPLSIRSLMAGLVLSFTRAFGEFGATLMFAGNIPEVTQTIPTAIYLAIETGNMDLAWSYVLISILFSFFLLLSINKTTSKN